MWFHDIFQTTANLTTIKKLLIKQIIAGEITPAASDCAAEAMDD